MAREQHIGESEKWYIGEDKTIAFEIYDSTEALIENVTGWAMGCYFYKIGADDPLVLTRTTGASTITITGSYNSDPATNTQRTNVLVVDTDTDNFQPGKYAYWLWRTDDGNETVLASGTVYLLHAPKKP